MLLCCARAQVREYQASKRAAAAAAAALTVSDEGAAHDAEPLSKRAKVAAA